MPVSSLNFNRILASLSFKESKILIYSLNYSFFNFFYIENTPKISIKNLNIKKNMEKNLKIMKSARKSIPKSPSINWENDIKNNDCFKKQKASLPCLKKWVRLQFSIISLNSKYLFC